MVAFDTSEMFSILQRARYRGVYAVIPALVGLRDRDNAYRHTSCEDADMDAGTSSRGMPLIEHGYVIEQVQLMHHSELCFARAKVLLERWQEQCKVQGCIKRGAAQSHIPVSVRVSSGK